MCTDLRKCDNCEKLLITSPARTKAAYEIIGEIWSKSQAGLRHEEVCKL